jgi:hypothetical protein
MYASRIQGHMRDELAAFSRQGEAPVLPLPKDSLELNPARSLQDLVIALVALLVALVHHRRSHSVTLGNRTGIFQPPRRMRRSLRWRVTKRD